MNYQGMFTDQQTGKISFMLRPQNDEEKSELDMIAERGLSVKMQSDGRLMLETKEPPAKATASGSGTKKATSSATAKSNGTAANN